MTSRRLLALLCAVLAWLFSISVLLLGLLFGLAATCDESCGQGEGWARDPRAWQWKLLAAAGVVVFACGTALLVSVWRRRRAPATASFLVGLVVTLALFTSLAPEWFHHLDRASSNTKLFFAAALASPLVALALTPPRRR